MRTDSDLDGLSDGDEDANHDGVRQSSETSPLIADTDGDWIGDYDEVQGTWCYNGETASCGSPNGARVTDATAVDTDDDGIPDGLETGATMARSLNDLSVGYSWRGPESQTDPVDADTDSDGLLDGLEDANRDGRREQNETSAEFADTDGDGLCDGSCSGHGEDLNLDGVRSQDDDGNWTETDPMAIDSDVDGISDGAEVYGSWCNSTETSAQCSGAPNAARVLLPLNPDTDGDGLRDGQETAGWKVAVWREITMEVIANYNVTSDPLAQNTDGDQNSDFVEFQNGSDPWKADTDGDGRNDTLESSLGENVTGFYMLRPQFMNLFLSADGTWTGLGVTKECRGGGLLGVGCTTYAKVSFQVWSWWGVGYWEINYGSPQLNAQEESEIENITGFEGSIAKLFCDNDDGRKSIGDEKCDRVAELWGNAKVVGTTISGEGAGQNVVNGSAEFQMTFDEDHINGPWVQARVFDIYGAGAQKTLKFKSTLEHILDFLAAIAKAIAEAVSFLLRMIEVAIHWLVTSILGLFETAIRQFAHGFPGLEVPSRGPAPVSNDWVGAFVLMSALTGIAIAFGWIMMAVEGLLVAVAVFFPGSTAIVSMIGRMLGSVGEGASLVTKSLTRFIDSDSLGYLVIFLLLPGFLGWVLGRAASAGGTPFGVMDQIGRSVDAIITGGIISYVATQWAVYHAKITVLDVIGVGFTLAAFLLALSVGILEDEGMSKRDALVIAVALGVCGFALATAEMFVMDALPFKIGFIDEFVGVMFTAGTIVIAHQEGVL